MCSKIRQSAMISRALMENIRGIKDNTKLLILTCIWMLTIVGSWGHILPVKDLQPSKGFNISKAEASWYAVEKYNTVPISLQSCLTLRVKASNYGDVFPFANSAYFMLYLVDIRTAMKQGFVGFAISFAPGMMLASVFDPEYTQFHLMMVLATDYDNYAVLTNCVQEPKLVCLDVFILTRQREPEAGVLQNARQAIRDRGFPLNDMVQIDQTNCPDFEDQ